MCKKSKKEIYLERLKNIHPSLIFDEDTVTLYKNRVYYECPEHGKNSASLANLLMGTECPQCAISKRANACSHNIDIFIQRGIEIYGDLHSFEKSEYISINTEVIVTCKKHGDFSAIPSRYYQGSSGCLECGKEKYTQNRKSPPEYYLQQLNEKYKNRTLDFSDSIFNTSQDIVEFRCSKHGLKQKKLAKLMQGEGCNECGRDRSTNARKIKRKEAEARLKKLFGDRYIFNLDGMKSGDSMVSYICPDHGEVRVRLHNLLAGNICVKCSWDKSKGLYNRTTVERNKEDYLKEKRYFYLVKLKKDKKEFLKIGIAKTLQHRLGHMRGYSKCKVEILKFVVGNLYHIFYKEEKILEDFKEYKYRPKSKFQGHTECININQKDKLLKIFKELKNDKELTTILK